MKSEKLKVKEAKTQKVATTASLLTSHLSPKKKATYKEQKEYEALTAEIESLTTEKATLEQQLSDGSLTDPAEITEASTRIGELLALLDEKELRWLELDELISQK